VPMARAKVSLRLAPGQDPDAAMSALLRHLEAAAPWGAHVTVHPGASSWPVAVDAEGPVVDAARQALKEGWGTDPVEIGTGGAIPFVKAFAGAYPEAKVLLWGVEDPDGRAHGADESLLLEDFRKNCVAAALLLERLADAS
jgi:acetylornithine deacetylase/succinyl-diaminopimelate desuccinylase-like protein